MTRGARSARPLYLEGPAGPIFGMFHQPPEGLAPRGTAVLIVPPWGWDETASSTGRRAWADDLAEAGHPTLRIDLPGTGESAGTRRTRVSWGPGCDAITAAAAWLATVPGVSRVAAIGLGLGGLLTAAAIARGARIDDLVLWSAPVRGRTFVREQRAFSALQDTRLGVDGASATDGLPEGWLESGGFVLSAETIAELGSLEMATMSFGGLHRALLLEREGIANDRALEAAAPGRRRRRDDCARARLDRPRLPPGAVRPAGAGLRPGGGLAGRRATEPCADDRDRGTAGRREIGTARGRGPDPGVADPHRAAVRDALRRARRAGRRTRIDGHGRLPERRRRPPDRPEPAVGRDIAALERAWDRDDPGGPRGDRRRRWGSGPLPRCRQFLHARGRRPGRVDPRRARAPRVRPAVRAHRAVCGRLLGLPHGRRRPAGRRSHHPESAGDDLGSGPAGASRGQGRSDALLEPALWERVLHGQVPATRRGRTSPGRRCGPAPAPRRRGCADTSDQPMPSAAAQAERLLDALRGTGPGWSWRSPTTSRSTTSSRRTASWRALGRWPNVVLTTCRVGITRCGRSSPSAHATSCSRASWTG